MSAQKNWFLYQLDVYTAFLNDTLNEEVHIQQPQRFIIKGKEYKVHKLKKALYGLKRALRACYREIDSYFIVNKFWKSKSEPTLYVKTHGTFDILSYLFMLEDMMKKYEMCDLKFLYYFLGIEIFQKEESVFSKRSMPKLFLRSLE